MKKNMKKILILLFVLVLLICITSFMNKDNESNNNEETNVSQQSQIEKDQMGEWNNNVYINDYLGVKFKLPEGWQFSSDEELKEINTQMQEQNGVYYLNAMNQKTGDNVNIFGEKKSVDITIEKYIDELKTQLLEMEDISYEIGETAKEEVAGKKYDTLEMVANISGIEITQKYYIYIIDENIIGIIVTSLNGENGINQIIECFK